VLDDRLEEEFNRGFAGIPPDSIPNLHLNTTLTDLRALPREHKILFLEDVSIARRQRPTPRVAVGAFAAERALMRRFFGLTGPPAG